MTGASKLRRAAVCGTAWCLCAIAVWLMATAATLAVAAPAESSDAPFALRLEGLSTAVADALRQARADAERQLATLTTPAARADVWGRLGMFYQAQHLSAAAEHAYGLALAEADEPRWRYLRAIVLEERGDTERAVADYRRVVAADTDNVPALYRLGASLLLKGDYAAASEALAAAEAKAPNAAIVLVARADVAAANGRLRNALALLERAWALQPDAGQIAYKLAMLHRRLGDTEAASAWLARRGSDNAAPEIDDPLLLQVAQLSRSARFFVKAGQWALERGDEEGAIEALRTARELAPQDADIALTYSHVLALGGRREPALDEVRRVLAANEQSARGWYLLAWLLRDADPAERREAHAAAQRSLALADDKRTRALAAALDMRAGRFAAAEAAYQALSIAEPDNADYRYWLAIAQLGKGDCAARAGLADALELRPSWGEAHLALARVEAICGAAEAARRRALALFKARDDVDTRLTLAIAEFAAGNVARANVLARAELPHADAALVLNAIASDVPLRRPFAEDSRWWLPAEVRGDTP